MKLNDKLNDCARILDKGRQVDTFILDFQKAFDTPSHELLKCKLYGYGIGGKTLKWIDSFLCDRQQRVVVNGVKIRFGFLLMTVFAEDMVKHKEDIERLGCWARSWGMSEVPVGQMQCI